MAIGLGARHRFGADQPAAAGSVLDEELLAERLAQALGEHPAQQVIGAAGRIGHHDPDRLARPLLRLRGRDEAAPARTKASRRFMIVTPAPRSR